MEYKIAVASTDGFEVDAHFGSARKFYIYDIKDGEITGKEERPFKLDPEKELSAPSGCGCGASITIGPKVELIADCKILVCAAAGPGALRQLEGAGISVFDVEMPVEEALEKITAFYK